MAATHGNGAHHGVEQDHGALEQVREGNRDVVGVGALEHERAEAVVDGDHEAQGTVLAQELSVGGCAAVLRGHRANGAAAPGSTPAQPCRCERDPVDSGGRLRRRCDARL